MNSIEALVDTVKSSKFRQSPYGIHCYFIKLDEKWGIKVYRCRNRRDLAFNDQSLMANLGFAPQVGCSFDIGHTKFCYVTEVAIPFVDGRKKGEKYYIWQKNYHKFAAENQEVMQKICELCHKMQEHNYIMRDTHFSNFGMLGDKLVCIDFGGGITSDWDDEDEDSDCSYESFNE